MSNKAERDWQRIRDWLSKLYALATEIRRQEVSQKSEEDHFEFMLFAFFNRQVDHARSMLALGNSLDTSFIARSMLEGMSLIKWVEVDPQNRALAWRSYAFVHDWRVMQDQKKERIAVDPIEQNTIETYLGIYGKQFLKSKAKEKLALNQPLPDNPYEDKWYSQQIREIFKAVGDEILYEKAYKPYSAWSHWNVGEIAKAIKHNEGQIVYKSEQSSETVVASIFAFSSLLHIVAFYNKYMDLAFDSKIGIIQRGFVEEFMGKSETKTE